MAEHKTYNIIGWGLAGATLAWHFHVNRIPCTVYDNGENHSSRVAAGMVNPIIFKRLTKGWRVDDLLPYADLFYTEIEEKLGSKLLSRRSISRVLASVEEQNSWAALEGDNRFKKYIKGVFDLDHPSVQAPYGIGQINSLGHLDVKRFLDSSKKYLSNHHTAFANKSFDIAMITDESEYIFCEGHQVSKNPFFSYLPMKASHGDVLLINAPDLKYEDILNKNMFVLPLGHDLYKIGSTYSWDKTAPEPTEEGRMELEDRLKSFCTFEYEVVSHEAGIRPTVNDRRPLLGRHPEKKNLYIFNGLGTKGVSIAPYFSEQMFQHVLNNAPIDDEVNISRHAKHYNV